MVNNTALKSNDPLTDHNNSSLNESILSSCHFKAKDSHKFVSNAAFFLNLISKLKHSF